MACTLIDAQDAGWDEIPTPVRDSMTQAMNTYDPEQEVLILLVRDGELGLEWLLFPGFRFGGVSPRDLKGR